MTQETQTVPGQIEPPEPTEAQLAGAAAKSFLLETLGEAFSTLPEILEDGTYVYNVGHSGPYNITRGIFIAKDDIDDAPYMSNVYDLVVLDRGGIFKIRYVQKAVFDPFTITGTKEVSLEEYPSYKERALAAIWEAPHFPQPPLNP